MKKIIKLVNLKLRNFKGASDLVNACPTGKNLNITFKDITNISGDNATLKSTCRDAYSFLLFGKNADDKKDFSIKTLKPDQIPYHRIEHEVEGLFLVDGNELRLRKVHTEKWIKPRGKAEEIQDGHETQHYVDLVPVSQKEYNKKVDELIPEDIAKLVSDPLYFNSNVANRWTWTDRRRILETMVGEIPTDEIFDKILLNEDLGDDCIMSLKDELSHSNETSLSKKLDSFKKKISAQKKPIKDSLETIPIKIGEAQRSKPQAEDYELLEKEIGDKNTALWGIDLQIEGNTKKHQEALDEIRKKQTELSGLKAQLEQEGIANKASKATKLTKATAEIGRVNADISSSNSKIRAVKSDIEINTRTSESNSKRIQALNKDNDELRNKWNEENAKTLTIDPHSLECPACNRPLEAADQQKETSKLTANFNKDKAAKLKRITDAGSQNADAIASLNNSNDHCKAENERLEKLIENYQADITKWEEEVTRMQRELTKIQGEDVPPSELMNTLQKQIEDFIVPEPPVIDNSDRKQKKEEITKEVDGLKERLAGKAQIEKLDKRILELQTEEKELSQKLADLERQEFTIEAFSKVKNETVESRVNKKFKLVKFKMFDTQVNGGEVECCDCTLNGVPYADVNTGGQTQAGIDIINALTEYFAVSAPIWIDNRESTIRIPECKSQIINLQAVKGLPLTFSYDQVATAVEAN